MPLRTVKEHSSFISHLCFSHPDGIRPSVLNGMQHALLADARIPLPLSTRISPRGRAAQRLPPWKTIDRVQRAGQSQLTEGKAHVIDRRLCRIRKTIMGSVVPNKRQWTRHDIITASVHLMRPPSPLSLDDDFPFDPPPKVAGRQSFPFFSPRCLHALFLHLLFTTQRCRPLSSHISSCPIFFP